MNWGTCYYDHFVNYLGSPVDRHTFEQNKNDLTIQILAFDGVFEACRVFCLLGLSHYTSELNALGEVYMVLDDGWEEVPYLLANALFFMVQQKMQLGWGISIDGIRNISPSLAQTFDKSALYLTTPFNLPDTFKHVSGAQKTGDMYLGVCISREEEAFLKDREAEALESVCAEKNIDPFSLRRVSCV
ncbi:MAG: suppressor of fused domain protein [Chloroflexi bacterium AL-W]|nr:suppressor of fused domain protein [Chloroflexi bacterium AL-N1]NOK67837.1 suppressor of fused domain protein [Chloroflexi bacterium AL-N10]NOK75394.1 suppressor of fused domain protein [Chloroflexi bacterium AL-N5]NOK82182.1 suppressor of fused domain protein [Chloroflexi bacterium AL-W]NOK90027.1 suppressor of fused domain protein [Chloroflexi bacterium AL-N15]